MVLENNFELRQKVYLSTDIDQQERIITAILINAANTIRYELSFGASTSWHYECEITEDKNVLKKV